MVVVRPGMFPATRMVAPNSPSARAKASMSPAAIPREASGNVTVERTRASLAPSVRATASRRGFTSSKATRAVRTRRGRDITIIATTTAFHVKTTSMPKRACAARPPGPRRPRNFRSRSPVATGGRTSGSETSVSRRTFPGKRRRASSNASASPKGARSRTASADTRIVNQTTGASTANPATSVPHEEAVSDEGFPGGFRRKVFEEFPCGWLAGSTLHESEGIGNRGAGCRRNLEGDAHLFRDGGIGPVDDSRVDVSGLDGGERGASVLGGDDLRGDDAPEPRLFEDFPGIDPHRNGRRFRDRERLDARLGEILFRRDLQGAVPRDDDDEPVGKNAATSRRHDESGFLKRVHLGFVRRKEEVRGR